MPYIKSAYIKQRLGSRSELLWTLSLSFDDGYISSVNLPDGFVPDESALSALGAIAIAELEGLTLDEDLAKSCEEIVVLQAASVRSFPMLLSVAILKALAYYRRKPLYLLLNELSDRRDFKMPTPLVSYFYGAASGETDLDFAEYLLMPTLDNPGSFKTKIDACAQINSQIAILLAKNGYESGWGLSGGWSAGLSSSIAVFNLLETAVLGAGWSLGSDCLLGVAVGSSQLFDSKTGKYHFGGDQLLSGVDLLSVFSDWYHQHHVAYLEDASDISDLNGADKLYAELGHKLIVSANRVLAGDELWLRKSLARRQYNCIAVNPSDFVKMSQLMEFVRIAQKHHLTLVLTIRNEDNHDAWVSDLAVALNFDLIRFGSLFGLDRAQKYNRLSAIEEELTS